MPELLSISYSPWSWRAKIALRMANIQFSMHNYIPTLSEPALRWRLGRWGGTVSVPVLFVDRHPIEGGMAIATWANQQETPIFPADREAEVRRWADLGDETAGYGRVLTTRQVMARPEALHESLPGAIRALGPVGMWIGQDAAGRILKKYPVQGEVEARLEALLGTLQAGLGGKEFLLGSFCWADVAAVIALHFVRPPAATPIGPASRECWTNQRLCEKYPGLLAYQDRVLERITTG